MPSSADPHRPVSPTSLEDLNLSGQLAQAIDNKYPFLDSIDLKNIHRGLTGQSIVSIQSSNDDSERHPSLSFVIPILQHFFTQTMNDTLFGCIIVPDRYCSVQVEKEIDAFRLGHPLRTLRLVKGKKGDYAIRVQAKQFATIRPHVIIATIGRLADHLDQTDGFDLRKLNFLAVQDADKILNTSSSWRPMEKILKALPPSRKIFVSSEITGEVRRLEERARDLCRGLPNPVNLVNETSSSRSSRATSSLSAPLSPPPAPPQKSHSSEQVDDLMILLTSQFCQAFTLEDGEEDLLKELSQVPQSTVDKLHTWLQDNKRHPKSGNALKLLAKLVEQTKLLPAPLFILGSDLTALDPNPFAIGGFAEIFGATYKGRRVALKRLREYDSLASCERARRRLCREALAWFYTDHPNILSLYGIDNCSFPDRLCLVSPRVPWGNLMDFINSPDLEYDPKTERNKLLVEVASGLAYLHDVCDIVHGDLHSANILVDAKRSARLMDLGLASIGDALREGTVATATLGEAGAAHWLAPELTDPDQSHHPRSQAADVFAFGRLIPAITTKKEPFAYLKLSPLRIRYRVYKDDLKPKKPTESESDGEPLTDQMWNLAMRCWEYESKARPPMTKIVEEFRSGALGALSPLDSTS